MELRAEERGIRIAATRGELVPYGYIERRFGQFLSMLRDNFEALPSRVQMKCDPPLTPQQVAAIRQELVALSRLTLGDVPDPYPPGGAERAA